MANTKPVGVAFSDPELVAGTTITGAAITSSTASLTTLTVSTSAALPAGSTIGGSSVAALGVITSSSATALAVGPNGTTNPVFDVDASTASQAAGLKLTGAATGGTVALLATDSGADTNLSISPKGAGKVFIESPVSLHVDKAAINATATATAAQVKTGYITSTSAAATTITLPTGTDLGTALGATQGTVLDLFIDNTAGASTVTIAVAVNGILSAAAAAGGGAGAGLLTVPSGVTGQACFRLMFSSATAYTFSRIA